MKLVVNRYEEITYKKLSELTEEFGARVFAKTRVGDVLPINGSGISEEEFSYALKAHFDFTVVDQEVETLFSVEFDGPSHRNEDQKRRDALKDGLCQRFGHPLLRIKANYLDARFRGMDLLTYFIEVWFMSRAFEDAQERGYIPDDEYWDPQMVVTHPKRKERFPYWISAEIQIRLQKLWEKKAIADYVVRNIVVRDEASAYRCLAWLKVAESSYLIVETGMRAQQFPVVVGDLLSQIAIFDVWKEFSRWSKGELKAKDEDDWKRAFQRFQKWDMMSCVL